MKQINAILQYFAFSAVLCAAFAGLSTRALAQAWVDIDKTTAPKNLYEIKRAFYDYWDGKTPGKGQGWKQFKRMEYFWESRVLPDGNFPNPAGKYNEVMKYNARFADDKKDSPFAGKSWTFLGPDVKPIKHPGFGRMGLGRVNALAFQPGNPNVIYAGAATGGVWKTTNGGDDWITFPLTEFMSIGITDIAVAGDGLTVYAATGDGNAGSTFGIIYNFSVGIIKTTNGGVSWERTNFLPGLAPENGILVYRLLIHPQNGNIVYAGTNAGVYRTTDGGGAWSKIGDYIGRDLEFKVDNPNIVFGALIGNGRYYLSKFDATTGQWEHNQQFTNVSRIAIATTQAHVNTVYAVCADVYGGFHSVYRTNNAGETWIPMASAADGHPNYLHRDYNGASQGGQGLYDLCIAASPFNANEVYIGGVNIWKSPDAGSSWTLTAHWTGYTAPYVHADHHALEYLNNGTIYSGNDGGIAFSTDAGSSWSEDKTNGLEITQFYRLGASKTQKDWIIAGSQDNGTSLYKNGEWRTFWGGDGMECIIDHSDEEVIYVSNYNGNFFRTDNGGGQFTAISNENARGEYGSWVTPMSMDLSNPNTLYVGYQNIWKSENKGGAWSKISNFGFTGSNREMIRSLAVSPAKEGVVYCASYDRYNSSNNKFFYTFNDGANWSSISFPAVINYIAPSPDNYRECYIVLGGYINGFKVFKFSDGDTTNISRELPNIPVNCILYQDNSPERLYIGTDAGVYYSDQSKRNWTPLDNGLPNVVVAELEIHYGSGMLRAATYGRGVWEVEISDCDLTAPEVNVVGELEFCEGDSVTLEVQGNYESIEWNTGDKGSKLVVKETGDYYAIVTDDKGCQAESELFSVRANSVPNMTITAIGDVPFCEGDSVRLKASIFFSRYEWSTGETGKYIYVKKPGDYYVKGWTNDDCEAESEVLTIETLQRPPKPEVQWDGETLTSSEAAQYQWYKDGEPVEGATGQSYAPENSGEYQVEIAFSNGCKNISDITDVVLSVLGDPKDRFSASIKPNPSEGEFILSAAGANGKAKIVVMDALGNKYVEIEDYASGERFERSFDLSEAADGAYFARVSIGSQTFVFKIIKK